MRKLLLATAATLGVGVGMATDVFAQDFPYPGTTPTVPNTSSFTVRINGRVRFYAGAVFDGDADTTTNPATGLPAQGSSGKQARYGFGTYFRLYPGFDGVTANGLKYGAAVEIRQDNGQPAGGGQFGSISGTSRTRDELYVNTSYGYIGTDALGTLRFGQTNGPATQLQTGLFNDFNDGGWDGDLPGLLAGAVGLVWPFADNGNIYKLTKIAYFSPQIAGFDFGVSWAPNSGAGTVFGCPGNTAGPGCDRLSSTDTFAEVARPRNTFETAVRYRGTFGPLGVALQGSYVGSGHVSYTGAPFTADVTTGGLNGGQGTGYDGFSVGDVGAAFTIAGLTFGGNYQFGTMNGGWGLSATGIQPVIAGNTATGALFGNPHESAQSRAWIVGASYTLGPLVVGASYLDYVNQGAVTAPGQRREQGVAAGGTYGLAPGLALFFSYIWDQRKQSGYDFLSGTSYANNAAVTAAGGKYKVSAQALSIGTSFAW